jgi:AcrR family transcriptional regulator
MPTRTKASRQRRESLSRERIVETAIALLDRSGEAGLTFRGLSEQLATGAGAIYWHIANKNDLLTAACDAVVERMFKDSVVTTPKATIRALALNIFGVIDAHPWVGSTLTSTEGLSPLLRILEIIGQQVRALGVPTNQQWTVASTLVAYILGVSKQNAANGQLARAQNLDRSKFLEALSASWAKLDPERYPFTRSVAGHLRDHDDRADFLAGINLILKGIDGH